MKNTVPRQTYLIAATRPWNIATLRRELNNFEGDWHLITKSKDLTFDYVKSLQPRYIFFPHWNEIVPDKIVNNFECVCFHETDVPFGRGGSPLQNLIVRGYTETFITALRMTSELDAGPVYAKKTCSLLGLAEEIYIRSTQLMIEMIHDIISNDPKPMPQTGEPVLFTRRTPDQSELPPEIDSLTQFFDFLRMLDADTYPRAFIKHNNFHVEFSRPALRADRIEATVVITKIAD